MHIEIRRWFDGTNTYYSSRVFRDGNEELLTEFAYGYGSQGLHETIKDLGFSRPTACGIFPDVRGFREAGHTSSEIDVTRKRDL